MHVPVADNNRYQLKFCEVALQERQDDFQRMFLIAGRGQWLK